MAKQDKDYALKLLESWMSAKTKLLTLILVANGAVLGTTVSIIKDNAQEMDLGQFAIKLSSACKVRSHALFPRKLIPVYWTPVGHRT